MSEFVNGYRIDGKNWSGIYFGSARTKPEDKYYLLAEKSTKLLSRLRVITGGEFLVSWKQVNKGAHYGGGTSVGLNIELPFEQHFNPYIDKDKNLNFDYSS